MQRCSHCHHEQADGAVFCTGCGVSLVVQQRVEYAVVLHSPSPPALIGATLTVLTTGHSLKLKAAQEWIVGRKDNQRDIYPDLDLGADGGLDAGVSRRHARIIAHESGYLIEDLASANGTFLNGVRLQIQRPVPLNSGDELRLGTLVTRFEIT